MERWVKPEEFVELSQEAEEIGFLGVMSGPLVRSSYRAGRLWATAMRKKGREIPPALAHIESSGTTRQEAATLLAARQGLTGNDRPGHQALGPTP
ncbi:lipoic acid synthetase [Sinomonas atrocyanea]|nr:lipoic acid synthetase [Sinomonas atrocyanea]MDR6623686.1 lipoic acid synthetase [Sinomonas atrocyanea]